MSSSAKIVTLVHISLPRISGGKSYEGTSVVADAGLKTIRKELELVASQNGEPAANLLLLEQVTSNYSDPLKKLEFKLNPPGHGLVYQSPPYATCEMETALEVDGRYFKVEEIKI